MLVSFFRWPRLLHRALLTLTSRSSLMRSIGPFGASSLFAFSVSRHLLGGQLVFLVMIVLAIAGAVATLALHEGGRAMAVEETAEE